MKAALKPACSMKARRSVRSAARPEVRQGRRRDRLFDKHTKQTKLVEADYCICTVPLKVLSAIPSDFSPDRQKAINKAVYDNSIKIAFQSPRFWETENQIYGGLSLTDRDTFITWYPSSGFHTPEGILVAGYSFGGEANRFGKLSMADKVAYAKGTIERLHPGRANLMKSPSPWSGARFLTTSASPARWMNRTPPPTNCSARRRALLLCGRHLSHVGAWQQGAIVSAHRAITMLDARHREGRVVTAARAQ